MHTNLIVVLGFYEFSFIVSIGAILEIKDYRPILECVLVEITEFDFLFNFTCLRIW